MTRINLPLSNGSSAARRLLVVEDMDEIRQIITMRLQREGFTVMAAASGEEAVELVQRQGLPHLAVVDMILPGMDGFAVANEVRRIGNIPIVFLSALADADTKVKAL